MFLTFCSPFAIVPPIDPSVSFAPSIAYPIRSIPAPSLVPVYVSDRPSSSILPPVSSDRPIVSSARRSVYVARSDRPFDVAAVASGRHFVISFVPRVIRSKNYVRLKTIEFKRKQTNKQKELI